ncbi:hypothetical protein PTSG_02725 [Salpingoeca rosetta]|uniref:Uncharacterized protein n=1 Tax=Salpingoeca rosetta (strain ATCC 50818 / BSB-021) TaxID=946362 RepID=F2U343_SALR5|nr:uncharacterized protein PTSG_02725 [Salpingoeca rosetta]EGD82037.1 hypothetical protein PTSG_02725 [Salpingoeca rosetta]|eukprot:XP_004996220.1 hypothetical protein PTSG_02725 [Salpingoeca rosetta]
MPKGNNEEEQLEQPTELQRLCSQDEAFKPLHPFLKTYRSADVAFADPESLADPFSPRPHLHDVALRFFQLYCSEHDEIADLDKDRKQALSPTNTVPRWNTLDVSARYISSKINLRGEKQISSLKDDIVDWLQDIPDKSVRTLVQHCQLVDICSTSMASVDNKDQFAQLCNDGLLSKVLFISVHFRRDAAVLDMFGERDAEELILAQNFGSC